MKRPDTSVRPFMKSHVNKLEAGQLFYVRHEKGSGYRPRCFVGVLPDGKTYQYQSYMNNDIFDAVYEEPHLDDQPVFVPKPFAMKIMQRGKALAEEVAEVFSNIPANEIQRSNLDELFERLPDDAVDYDAYEAIRQAVRRLGWQDASIVRRQNNGWMVDDEAFEYMVNALTGKVEAEAANTTVTIAPVVDVVDSPMPREKENSFVKKLSGFLFGNSKQGDSCGI